MTGLKIGAAALGLMIGVLVAEPASAWKRGPVQVLAVLPDVTPGVKSSVEGAMHEGRGAKKASHHRTSNRRDARISERD